MAWSAVLHLSSERESADGHHVHDQSVSQPSSSQRCLPESNLPKGNQQRKIPGQQKPRNANAKKPVAEPPQDHQRVARSDLFLFTQDGGRVDLVKILRQALAEAETATTGNS